MTTPRPVAASRRWPLSRIVGAAVLVVSVFSVAAMVAGGLALARLNQQQGRIENIIDPAALQARALDAALLDQETGLRGYALSGQRDFLAPYTSGLAAETSTVTTLRGLVTALPAPSAADLQTVIEQAARWRSRYAEPLIKRSYALHANAFVSKPVDFEHFIEAVRQIDDFFLTLVKLPVLPALDGP